MTASLTKFFRLAILLGLALLSATAAAQDPESHQDPLLDSMMGTWTGNGVVNDVPVNEQYVWEWVINHQFARVTNTGMVTSPEDGGTLPFENQIFLQAMADGTYRGVMFGSFGEFLDLTARVEEGSTLVLDVTDDLDQRRVTLVCADENSCVLHYLAPGLEERNWTDMGQVTLSRQP